MPKKRYPYSINLVKVLVFYPAEQKDTLGRLSEVFGQMKISYNTYMVTGNWQRELPGSLDVYTHLFFIITKTFRAGHCFSFISGYGRGRGFVPFVFLPDGDVGLPPYSGQLPASSSYDIVGSYLSEECRRWRREKLLSDAKSTIEEAGIAFTDEGLVSCVISGKNEIIKHFFNAGFSSNVSDRTGVHLLSLAVRKQDTELISYLIHHGADINAVSSDRGNTAIMDAAADADSTILSELIDAGAELDIRSKNGQTALILAVGKRDQVSAELLIKAGAEVSVKDNLGMTASKYAELFKCREITDLIAKA